MSNFTKQEEEVFVLLVAIVCTAMQNALYNGVTGLYYSDNAEYEEIQDEMEAALEVDPDEEVVWENEISADILIHSIAVVILILAYLSQNPEVCSEFEEELSAAGY